MFEDTKGANRNRKSKDRQQSGLNKIDKGTNNDLQNTT
jgi:phage gp37-like protein